MSRYKRGTTRRFAGAHAGGGSSGRGSGKGKGGGARMSSEGSRAKHLGRRRNVKRPPRPYVPKYPWPQG